MRISLADGGVFADSQDSEVGSSSRKSLITLCTSGHWRPRDVEQQSVNVHAGMRCSLQTSRVPASLQRDISVASSD